MLLAGCNDWREVCKFFYEWRAIHSKEEWKEQRLSHRR